MAKTYEIRIGEDTYEVAATLGACVTYADEFRGKVDGPYVGLMTEDLLTLYNRCATRVAVPNEDGGGFRLVDNDNYEGVELHLVPLMRLVWACATATKSTKLGWPKFIQRCLEAEFNASSLGGVYDVVVNELGDGTIFRLPEGQGGSGEADEGQQA